HAPGPLARDAPVRTRFDRGFNAVLAPVGNPVDVIDGVECLLAKSFSCSSRREEAPIGSRAFIRANRSRSEPGYVGACGVTSMINLDKPLIHRAENDRRLAAPTMRIAVGVILPMHQRLAFTQELQ